MALVLHLIMGCVAVKNARDNHIKWELENGHNPYEDWGQTDETNNKKC